MPWVDKEKCIGCSVCVAKCPVNAISMEGQKAKINMNKCIHCGICHKICPQEAVEHDSKKIPAEVKVNVEMTKKFMEDCAKYLGSNEEKEQCLKRMIKHFNKEKIVAGKTLEQLKNLENV
jgi:ferredoxin